MSKVRKCGNCKRRYFSGWDGIMESCWGYEMACCEQDEIDTAVTCESYEEGTPVCLEKDDDYCPSSSSRDYGPSNPWDAPGMSISDFI